MEKNIKDYLHLYYGSMVARFDGKGERFKDVVNGAWLLEAFEAKDGKNYYTYQLILRPLSDMTEEEIAHLFFLDGGIDSDFIRGEAKDGHYIQVEYSHQGEKLSFMYSTGKLPVTFIPYLLKQSFDLFGLIESGLAIDKSKIIQLKTNK